MSKDTFYFSHDYNTRNDIKIKDMIVEHGMLGYGVFWSIIEELYNNANELPTKYKTIAYELRVDEKTVESIVNDFDLFVIEDGFFGSKSVETRLEARALKSKKARESAFKRWNKEKDNANAFEKDAMVYEHDANALQDNNNALQSECDTNAIKERKEKEKKEKENKDLLKKETKYTSLNFKNDLLDFGFKESLVDEWLQVRRNKKSTNSKTALSRFINQVKLHGGDKNEILEECVSKSWTSFNSTWNIDVKKPINQNYFNNPMNGDVKKPYKPPFAL